MFNTLRKLLFLIMLCFPTFGSAEQVGRFISIESIELNDEVTLPAGSEVNFLGVIDVTLRTAPSGKLATFVYRDQVFNADASLFYEQNSDERVTVYPARTFDSGDTASMCSTIVTKRSNAVLDFAEDNYPNYFELTSDQKVVDAYSVTRPKDIFTRRDRQREFCIEGLEHSTRYQLKILPNLEMVRGEYTVSLTAPISLAFKTPQKRPSVKVDASKSIVVNSSNAVMPMEYVNVNELEVTLHKIDLRSLPAYNQFLQVLDGYDVNRLENYWGEQIAKQTIELDGKQDETSTVNLDFSDYLEPDASGLFVATFSSPELDLGRYQNRPTQWFSVSDIALQFYHGLNHSDIFLTSFSDALPVVEAEIQIIAANNKTLFEGRSDQSGRVRISNSLLKGSDGFAPEFLIVSSENRGLSVLELTDLDQKPRFLSGGLTKNKQDDVYLTSDRGVYRPGEEIHLFGVVRGLDLSPRSDKEFTLRVVNSADTEIYKAVLQSDRYGAFSETVSLKATTPLGRYSVQILSIDEELLSEHSVELSDFVPLTIEAQLTTDNDYWALSEEQTITLKGDYYSGGPAADLSAELVTFLQEVNSHGLEELAEFTFGSGQSSETKELDSFGQALDQNGELTASIISDYAFNKNTLYDVVIEGTIYDVGGRANRVKKRLPLDTVASYVGVRPRFSKYAKSGVPPEFAIASVDRKGAAAGFDGITYTVNKVYYDYNWYYDDGWRWSAVRVSAEAIESGTVSGGNLTLSSPVSWGRYELKVANSHGFETAFEFYVGWGSNTKPASEPEQLSFAFDGEAVRGKAPFDGKLSIIVADHDVQSVIQADVTEGNFEVPFKLATETEPGVHLLASLVRPIETGSEHLPQIALGKTWMSSVSDGRVLDLEVNAPSQIDSQMPFQVSVKASATLGSIRLFVVDEGIHALSNFKNKSVTDHYLDERALNFGIFSNFGQLISQDMSLRSIRVGGDEGMLSSAAEAPKSEFFKTYVAASPLLDIQDGSVSYTFDKTDEWEGRLRLVAVAVGERGFGFSEKQITVQDPVSIDVSMPRFVAPNDFVNAKMNIRWNEFEGPIDLETIIGSSSSTRTVNPPMSKVFGVDLPIKADAVGNIPVRIVVSAGNRIYRRTYEIVSRNASYPVSEVRSVELQKQNWLGVGSTSVKGYNPHFIDFAAPGNVVSATLSSTLGVNLNQVVAELNRYPYGCVEQVSSKTRGLLALAQVRGLTQETEQKIQLGIDNLLAKQKSSGGFGYWSKNSRIYEVYQPYAVDTLQQLLPYADNQAEVVEAINRGLEYLYRTTFSDERTKLYAYGVLARSGFEVTSRARYAIDAELNKPRLKLQRQNVEPSAVAIALEDFTLSYWVAAHLNDTKRMIVLSEKVRLLLDETAETLTTTDQNPGLWVVPSQAAQGRVTFANSAPKSAHLIATLDEDLVAPPLLEVVANTQKYLSQRAYRSTRASAKLVALQQFQNASLAGTKITIDGNQFELNDDGSVPLTNQQLRLGFEISHNGDGPLFLNVKTTGQRRFSVPRDNGYKVTKWWYDRTGKSVDLQSGVLSAEQGDLFTVVVEIDRTKSRSGSDILLTDLLPTGFEIEDATIADPKIDGRTLDFDQGEKPYFTAEMDDRFIAHFDDRWIRGDFALLRYTVRAAYQGEAQIPDATVEEMYAPEVNGRSRITRAVVAPR